MDKKRVIGILTSYIDNDLACADPGYVREVLSDVCGCTDDELKELLDAPASTPAFRQ